MADAYRWDEVLHHLFTHNHGLPRLTIIVMEFSIRNVDFKADEWEIASAIASQVLHVSPGLFVTNPEERLPNFKVRLNKSQAGGVQNDGTGVFTLTKSLGKRFKRLNEKGQIDVVVRGKKLRFLPNTNAVGKSLSLELEKAPFIDPEIARDRGRRIDTLRDPFLVAHVQIGPCYRPFIGGVKPMINSLCTPRRLLLSEGCTPTRSSIFLD